MTNHWNDYQHSDVFMAIGGNTAENHPISMRWIEKARKEKGAKLISVDPRQTRTGAVSDLYVPIRPGTNSAFMGWLIHFALNYRRDNGDYVMADDDVGEPVYHEEYVKHYTNATYLVTEEYSGPGADGLFAGAMEDERPDVERMMYDQDYWAFQTDGDGNIQRDMDMENPQCVFQIMKDFYADYDLETISRVTGCPKDTLLEAAEMFCESGKAGKAGNILYAMGITQFTHGAQNVRGIAVLQLLLGNMGIAGGGVNAQRGQSNVQGATDMAMLYHIIPGYNPMPQQAAHPTLEDYLEGTTPADGWWVHRPKYIISLLKEFYGDNATADNDFGYDWFPKLDGYDHSHIAMYKLMSEGKVKGMINWADNPAVSGPTAASKREYQKNLDWLVSIDLVENETAAFWKAPGVDPAEVDTEVFILPASNSFERAGSKANSGRWIQWQWRAQEAPGDCRSDLWIANEMFKYLQKLYEEEGGETPEPITNMKWDYDGEDGEVDLEKVCIALNGYKYDTWDPEGNGTWNNNAKPEPVTNFVGLADDGSTACGNWLYSGYYNDYEHPPTMRREPEKEGIGSHLNWSFAWPLNRRIVYNRCSADPDGNPWNPDAPVIWWDDNKEEWVGNDIPDIPGGWDFEKATEHPFIMLENGHGNLFSSGVNDAPLPIHYEPADSPVRNLIYPDATYNPVSQRFYEDHTVDMDDAEEREKYDVVLTTYRVTEHYQTGSLTRNIPWLNEMMPELFIEISEELAQEKGIKDGDKVRVNSKRTDQNGHEGVSAKACVTKRFKPMTIGTPDGGEKEVHVVGLPFHWGYKGLATGDVTNDLCPSVGDPNTTIPESKASLCRIEKEV